MVCNVKKILDMTFLDILSLLVLSLNYLSLSKCNSYSCYFASNFHTENFHSWFFLNCANKEIVSSDSTYILQCIFPPFRGYRERKKYKKTMKSIVFLQCCVRRMYARREYKRLRVSPCFQSYLDHSDPFHFRN